MAEDEMVGRYHQHNGHGFGWTPGIGDGQGSLVCCSSWGHKESDMTERLNNTFIVLSHWWPLSCPNKHQLAACETTLSPPLPPHKKI